jgi:hypothetical protein
LVAEGQLKGFESELADKGSDLAPVVHGIDADQYIRTHCTQVSEQSDVGPLVPVQFQAIDDSEDSATS